MTILKFHYRFNRWLTASLLIALLAVTGCNTVPIEEKSDELRLLLGELKAREQVLDKRQALLKQRGNLLARLELQQETVAEQAPVAEEPNNGSLMATFLPAPTASAGQCFRLTRLPPRLSAEPQTVVIRDAADQVVVTSALFVPETFSVIVGYEPFAVEGDPRRGPVPMKTHTETFELKAAYESWEAVPATFDPREEPLLAAPAHQDFKPCQRAASSEGWAAQWCATTVAAEYQSVKREVVRRLSDVRPISVAAERVSVDISEPEDATQKASMQPVVREFTRQRLIQAASYKREVLLPEFKALTIKQLTRPAALAWREVVCVEQDRKPLLAAVQKALNERGYEAGVADGAWGEKTALAIAQFRSDKLLPDLGRDLGIELLRQLEVSLPL